MTVGARCIALVGAECTGKTSLATSLAERLPALRLTERLREFCEEAGRTPRADEQSRLFAEQVERETRALARAAAEGLAWVICDSTPLVTALYSVHYFADETLLERAVTHQRGYALTLLTDVDPPWEADGIQRDGPATREAFHRRLADALAGRDLVHVTVSGAPQVRIDAALAAIAAIARV